MRPFISTRAVYGVLVGIALTGCGAGSKVISDVKFENQVVNGNLQVAMDATLAPGGLVLPQASFPLYNPKNPSQVLGQIQTGGLHVIVSVDATKAMQLPGLADGSTLPNGAGLPLVLPSGLTPIGIPAFNSNSRVYLAVNGDQIMLGVAVAIAKNDSLKLPLSIFLPFTINPQIHGTGGFFLGDQQGLGIFALREKVAGAPASIAAFARGSGGKIEVRQDGVSRSGLKRLEKTFKGLRSVRLD